MGFLNRIIPNVVFKGFVQPSKYGNMYVHGIVTNLPDRYRLTLYGWSDLPDDKCFKCDLDDVLFMQCDGQGVINLLHDACDNLAWMAHEPQALQDFPT